MKYQDNIKSIPLGEVKCIWMTAGAVDYKLCRRSYECDSCEYYDTMRQGITESNAPETPEKGDSYQEDDVGKRIKRILENYDLKTGLLYKENHTWVRIINSAKLQVGIDSFAGNLLPKNRTIVLPVEGNYLNADQPCSWITIGDSAYTIKSPVSGYVTEVNYDLIRSSEFLSSSPYDAGWLFYIKPSKFHKEEKNLLKVSEMNRLTKLDIEKINRKISFEFIRPDSPVGNTMMDGGVSLNHLFDIVGPKKFNTILSCIFKFFV
jgi:glycine cleavage system H protein